MKKFLTALLALCMLAFGAAAESAELPVVRISVEGVGDIYAELYPETAPITVENFLKLTDQGFYNGLTFHRIISGFMVQGGDPLGNGTGGSEETIKGEFSANGVENPLQHSRGVLSMARSSAMDSASSQFFIMHADASHLDGNYAAFGKVLAGMNIVDALCRDTPVTDSNGTVAAADQPRMKEIVRVSREEAEKAMAREAENGLNGRYEDPVLGLSFPVPEGWSPAQVPEFRENRGIILWKNANGTETNVWSAAIYADTVYDAVLGPELKRNGAYFAAESDGLFHPLNKFTRSDAVRVVYNLRRTVCRFPRRH